MNLGRKTAGAVDSEKTASRGSTATRRRGAETPVRQRRAADGPAGRTRTDRTRTRRPHEPRTSRQGPQSAPAARPAERPARPTSTSQAKARAKARKAKAPKVVRPPLHERLRESLLTRLDGLDLRPQALLARVPFVVLVIAALGIGLAITLWLSTDAAQRSYQLGSARAVNNALTEQKEALERDVLQGESAPALADAARNLGMIPSRDTAHLVQDPAGNWVVVGKPKPAEGASPPPLNTKLPVELPPAPPAPAPATPKPGAAIEVPRRIGAMPPAGMSPGASPVPGTEVPVLLPVNPGTPHAPTGALPPGPAPLPGPADTLAIAPPAPVAAVAPTVAPVPDVAVVNPVIAPAPAAVIPPGAPSQ